MSYDKEYNRMIHSRRWLRLRRDKLSSQPLCERCEQEGYVKAATEVHHRTPVESAYRADEKHRLMFDIDNLCSLCHDCHVKAHMELGRSGRKITAERNKKLIEETNQRFFGE